MSVKNKSMELLNYINAPMSKENIELIYSANNIRYEKCELYCDFILSLILLIFETYMGDEITNETEKRNHFRWCWHRNIENFEKEGISFKSAKLHDYFLNFMLEVYYPMTKKKENQKAHKNIIKLWLFVLDFNVVKSKSDMDYMIEVYKLFDYSLKSDQKA